jgi:hypothetical protein
MAAPDHLREQTLSLSDIDLLGQILDACEGKFHGEVRLAGKDLRRAKKLEAPPLEMTRKGRLTDKHYELTEKGRAFITSFRARSKET